jgi:meso-butanediol dehydrogenase / (S,S)-butanediol dehydrogenase / diacetyl reductase
VNPANRTAVVTGAASGIGRATVELLSDLGWSVAALDRDAEGLATLNPGGSNTVVVQEVDVTDSRAVDDAFHRAASALGPINAVVAAAGVWTPGTVADLSDEQWSRAISINLTGTFNTARGGVRQMLSSGGGSFVAIASDVGLQGSQQCASYVVAKHGVIGLVRSMALDFGHRGVRTNAVCPGFVETAMTEEIFGAAPPELLRARNSEVPIGRFAQPSEVATVIQSVIDPAFSFVNGATLLVDGGATAGYYTPREG